MNWRTIVLRYAAKVLDEIGKHDLADELRDVDVPILDGGGIMLAKPGKEWRLEFVHRSLMHGGLETGQREMQNYNIDKEIEDRTLFLIPVYPGAVKSIQKPHCKCA